MAGPTPIKQSPPVVPQNIETNAVSSKMPNVIYSNNFEQTDLGVYDLITFNQEWRSPRWSIGVKEGRVAIKQEKSEERNHILCVNYPEGIYGTKESGALWNMPLEATHNELYVSYWVKFPENFDFVQGGKLPGLAGGQANTGGGKPTGEDGWSARIMWKADGEIVQYVYHPDQPGHYGENLKWNRKFIPGQWYQLETRIVMNQPGESNGVIQSWLNGELVLDRNHFRFRDSNKFGVDQLLFQTFFGGDNASWATTKDESIEFDNFVISIQPISH